MKKYVFIILPLLMLISIGFTSCGNQHEHNIVQYDKKEPTCVEEGYEAYEKCTECDYTTQRIIPTIEHNYVDNVCTICDKKEDSIGLRYQISDDNTSYSLIGIGTCKDNDIVIPAMYNNLPVTSIGDWAFIGCSSLTSITIPDSVTSIGSYAFDSCSSLTSITIPNSVTSIGYRAFSGCSSLTSITIPDSVTSIGEGTFLSCINLTSITIPEGVTDIGKDAFSGCSNLTSLIIPEGVISIGDGAFSGCYKLFEIYNLSSLSITTGSSSNGYIGYNAKVIHTSLNEESHIKETEDGYIYGYDNNTKYYLIGYKGDDTNLVLPELLDGNSYSINKYAFNNCNSLLSIEIPNSVISIGYRAFSNCSSLTSIEIPEGVTSIGDYAFYICTTLTSITIPDSVTSIGNCAFSGCSSLTSITIPKGVISIGLYTFSNCSSLTSITIPKGVISIAYSAFSGCYKLFEIYNLSSLSITVGSDDNGCIGSYAKVIHTSLNEESHIKETTDGYIYGYDNNNNYYLIGYKGHDTNLVLPELLDGNSYSINNYAFSGCSSLTSITIPAGVTSIGSYAFSGCSNLTSITIPDSVTSIGEGAFSRCFSLIINCEITSQPSEWDEDWNSSDCPVVWGYIE